MAKKSFTNIVDAMKATGLTKTEILYECNRDNIGWYDVGGVVYVDDDDVLEVAEKKETENQRAAG